MATYNGHNEDSSGNILLSIGNGMTATLETGTTASQAYSKGTYVFFNNRLCKVTAAITSGETLEIGTNLLQTTLGNELTSHLRASDGSEFYFDVIDNKPGYYPSATKTASEFVPFKGSDIPFAYIVGFSTGSISIWNNIEQKSWYVGFTALVYNITIDGVSFKVQNGSGNGVRISENSKAIICGKIVDNSNTLSLTEYAPGSSFMLYSNVTAMLFHAK